MAGSMDETQFCMFAILGMNRLKSVSLFLIRWTCILNIGRMAGVSNLLRPLISYPRLVEQQIPAIWASNTYSRYGFGVGSVSSSPACCKRHVCHYKVL